MICSICTKIFFVQCVTIIEWLYSNKIILEMLGITLHLVATFLSIFFLLRFNFPSSLYFVIVPRVCRQENIENAKNKKIVTMSCRFLQESKTREFYNIVFFAGGRTHSCSDAPQFLFYKMFFRRDKKDVALDFSKEAKSRGLSKCLESSKK